VLALSTRTGILFVARAQALERENPEVARPAAVQLAAQERCAPVLTTATALLCLLAPFVILGPRPGLELIHPMSVVILGGLVTSTLVTLFVVPALYLHLATGREQRLPDAVEPIVERDGALAGVVSKYRHR